MNPLPSDYQSDQSQWSPRSSSAPFSSSAFIAFIAPPNWDFRWRNVSLCVGYLKLVQSWNQSLTVTCRTRLLQKALLREACGESGWFLCKTENACKSKSERPTQSKKFCVWMCKYVQVCASLSERPSHSEWVIWIPPLHPSASIEVCKFTPREDLRTLGGSCPAHFPQFFSLKNMCHTKAQDVRRKKTKS